MTTSKSILKMLELTRRRQKAWRERREHMEGIRQRAVARAAEVRRDNHAALISRLATLPATLTKDELLAFLDGKYAGSYESFCNRLRRHKLMTYDPFLGEFGAWVNHCVPEREQS
jgi:cell division protein ZapA (FtsZ GTPase activity inhibitor)